MVVPERILTKGSKKSGDVTVSVSHTVDVDCDMSHFLQRPARMLREWFEEAHKTGKKPDSGLQAKDQRGRSWQGYDTGLLANNWTFTVSGTGPLATAHVVLTAPDEQRFRRIETLTLYKGLRLVSLRGRARETLTWAMRLAIGSVVKFS